MSTPYTPVGGTQAGEFTYDYDDAHGQGLVTFAGVMLMIAAVLNTLYGIAAIDQANFFVHDARVRLRRPQHLGLVPPRVRRAPVLCRLCDLARRLLGPMARRRMRERQRDPADAVDPAYPILAMTILTLDIIVNYGLLAYGGRRRSAREARARAQGGVRGAS